MWGASWHTDTQIICFQFPSFWKLKIQFHLCEIYPEIGINVPQNSSTLTFVLPYHFSCHTWFLFLMFSWAFSFAVLSRTKQNLDPKCQGMTNINCTGWWYVNRVPTHSKLFCNTVWNCWEGKFQWREKTEKIGRTKTRIEV